MVLPRILCAISGGVDSAVAALLLKQHGFNVSGIFMRNWDLRDEVGHCDVDEDCDYAMRVCKTLNIPFHEINLVKEYWNHVFEPMIEEYVNGNTPNPDVFCNHYVKFDAMHKKCQSLFDGHPFVVATGHYARTSLGVQVLNGLCTQDNALLTSADENKDQTFFLSKMTQQALRRTYFPLGNLLKSQVKEIARSSDLSYVLKRKESMGICFIGKREFSNFIKDYLPPKNGRFICHESGKVLGYHNGYYGYTIGQRSKLGGMDAAYIAVHKDIESGDVFVVPGTNHPSMYARSLIVELPHWIRDTPDCLKDSKPFPCQFRFMHREALVNCSIHKLSNANFLVILDQPRRAITVGQNAAFYVGNECLGGARICDAGPSMYECSANGLQLLKYRRNRETWQKLAEVYKELISYEQWESIEGYNLFKSRSVLR